MNILTIFGLAAASLLGSAFANFEYLQLLPQELSSNSAANGTKPTNCTTLVTRTTTMQTIYTSPSNSTSEPPRILVVGLSAVARKSTGVAK